MKWVAGVRRQAFFLPRAGSGQRFCLLSQPAASSTKAVLYVHPFAEEMNKSRRMAALASAAMAERGWTVMQIDLHGCGDSSGEFGEASWSGWIDDVAAAHAWLREQGYDEIVLWGLRSGALLISAWLQRTNASCPLLLWQPVGNGKQHLNQFLRLKGVGGMLDEADAKAVMTRLRADLAAGKTVGVAGYALAPELVSGMEGAALVLPDRFAAPVHAFEVGASDSASVSPALAALLARWSAADVRASVQTLCGPSFWQTQEIEDCPALIDASCAALDDLHAFH